MKKTMSYLMTFLVLAAASTSFASTVNLGTLTSFTGGDAGEGIDLTGNIVYAFNLGPGSAETVQGVTFAAAPNTAPPAGLTTTAGYQIYYPDAQGGLTGANYGSTANDDALEAIINNIWYDLTAGCTFDLAVVSGTQYKLQLILQEAYRPSQGTAGRNFDVSVETASPSTLSLAVDDLVLSMETNGDAEAGPDQGLVYSYTFTAADTSFRVGLVGVGGSLVIIGGVTLEELPAPASPAVTLDGSETGGSVASTAPLATQVGVLSMVNTNPVGFAYSLHASGDMTHFDIPVGTSNLVTAAALTASSYDIVVLATNASDGFWTTNSLTIDVDFPDVATGGNSTNDIGGYRIHTFTSSGSFNVLAGGNVEVLVVAGGGGGGAYYYAGGGGAGGFVTNNAYSVLVNNYTVTVGAGGPGAAAGSGSSGGDSIFDTITAYGGGGGGGATTGYTGTPPGSGGSGGGASHMLGSSGGTATPAGQGNDGGASNPADGGGGGG
ncbi:MAG: hypothetical protein HN919_12280, partial [Verrucomicrobia bacterium]|nr:hypothetical protein [Verrucomicrobiota bacterium]